MAPACVPLDLQAHACQRAGQGVWFHVLPCRARGGTPTPPARASSSRIVGRATPARRERATGAAPCVRIDDAAARARANGDLQGAGRNSAAPPAGWRPHPLARALAVVAACMRGRRLGAPGDRDGRAGADRPPYAENFRGPTCRRIGHGLKDVSFLRPDSRVPIRGKLLLLLLPRLTRHGFRVLLCSSP